MNPHYFAFGVKYNGIDIFDEEKIFRHKLPRSGISYHQELDWVFAAWRDHTSADEFCRKSGAYQSMIIAAYRIERQIEAVLSEQSHMDFERKQAEERAKQGAGRGIF